MSDASIRKVASRLFPWAVGNAKDYALLVLNILQCKPTRRRGGRAIAARFRPYLEDLEGRIVPSFADGNGAVVTNLAVQNNGAQLVISFDGPLNANPSNPVQSPTNAGNYSVQVPSANPEVVTSSASSVSISSAGYSSSSFQVTLNLGSALAQGTFYRVFINGAASSETTANAGLVDQSGNAIDGDYDDTASGNFYALFAWTTAGTPLLFADSGGDGVALTITGPGNLESWRALDGDFDATNLAAQAGLAAGAIQQLTVASGALGQTTLSGSATFAPGNSVVVVPAIAGQGVTFTNALPPYFQLTAPPLPTPPTPVVANTSNLPYTLQIQQVSTDLPAVQSPVSGQDNLVSSPFHGYWLMFGGRTNGLHNFNPTDDFPPQMQNQDIFVINPATWQTWTVAWSATDVPTALVAPLYSTNQQSFQQGDTLYAVGGYGAPEQVGGTFGSYTTYDTLTALSIDGLISAVVNGVGAAALSGIQQIQDPRLQVTGGAMQMLGSQAYLVLGQDFQGEYFSPLATQTYTDEIRTFQISYSRQLAGSLGIADFQVQNDQVNFRRRDYGLGNVILPNLQAALEVFGGVFTPGASSDPAGGQGYRTPIVVNGLGATQVSQYQQFFNQYSAANVALFDAQTQSMFTVFLGGISLYDYNFATEQLTADTELPFVDDVTTLMQSANGASQEFIMPSQLPGLYGAEASFFATPGLTQYANGVIQLDALSQATTLGYMFGGIHSTVPNTTDPASQTSATGALFRVVLVPVPKPASSPTTYTVTSLADSAAGAGNSGTLRYVLNLANGNHTGTAGTPDHILFATGAGTIEIGAQSGGAPLPALASNEVAVIDATTAVGYNGVPVITLDGTSATLVVAADGLTISGGSSTIKGFDIVHFSGSGIELDTNGGDTVLSSYIGITSAGALAGNGGDGIVVSGTANNVIGSTTAVDSPGGLGGNVVSGNGGNGVRLSQGVQNNTVAGNYIGTDATGTMARGNGGDGIQLAGAANNSIANNVISSNSGNGIVLDAANNNQIDVNFIGTDATGTLARGNAQNGVLVTNGATGNLIGGQATGGNDPTNGVFVRPPQGNLISGNHANGVLITGQATQNTLSGNFVGTALSGIAALPNTLDGIAIDNADGNALLGCALTTNPFVFYNVISGNGANGVQITDSNNTTVQGNFLGLGADNKTAVGNFLNGIVVEGSSANTVMGGPIPLGNVDAANGQNGILIQDTASVFTSYNTFTGLAAFQTYTNLGNGADGMKITSTGGNILLRTNVISENGNDGIEISGAATGVRVAGNIIGLDTNGDAAMGNKNNGVEVGGTANNNIIGGPQPTFNIIAHNAISANGGNGVAIDGAAHDNRISFSFIGTDLTGLSAFGNANAGVLLGPGTSSNTVGSADPNLFSVISGNLGDGVEMLGTNGNTVVGALIGSDLNGLLPLPNSGNGVYISNGFDNVIGRTANVNGSSGGPANLIAFNAANGVFIDSGSGNAIQGNSIHTNALLGIDLGPLANMNQAAPVLTAVSTLPLATQVSGTLASTPSTTFTIEFFGNTLRQSSGRILLGSMTATTDASGNASFTFLGPTLPIDARFITATATDPQHNTSEFSAVSPFSLPPAFAYDLSTGVLTITGVNFYFTQATTANGSSINTTYTFTIDGVTQTFSDTALSSVVVNGVGAGDTAILVTNDVYLGSDNAIHETPEIVSLGAAGPGDGQVMKLNASNQLFVFLQLNNFSTSYAYVGKADSGLLYGATGETNGFVTAGNYSYMSAPGYFHLIQGAPYVYGYSASPTDFAYHYDGTGPSTYRVDGTVQSYMSGTDNGASFFNVAENFRFNTAVALHPDQDTAYFVDSPGNDVFSGKTSESYMYSADAAHNLTEMDSAYGFATVFAVSVNGGTDFAYDFDAAHNILTGNWVVLVSRA